MEKAKNRQRFLFPVLIFVLLAGVSCAAHEPDVLPQWYPETNANGDSVSAVYESRVPCPDCERLKFSLVIYENAQHAPVTYIMSRIYVGKGDDRTVNNGDVLVTQGTSVDPSHTVYRLTSGAPAEFQWFWKINDDLLFILDSNLTPMVGDAGHGYVLNRVR